MKIFRADLHIHTVLSPCGDLDMSPLNIISEAVQKGIDIIGITDHNSTRHCRVIKGLAAEKGIFVMQGAEVTTKEEVHCLVFFETTDTLDLFQEFLDANLPDFPNDPAIFGYQLQVDENENIIYEEKRLLINAISKRIDEVEVFVHSLDGIFIPAHIDRRRNSVYSQLGFLPENINADALEVSRALAPEQFSDGHPEVNKFPLIRNSDAHYPGIIGIATTLFHINKPSFSEIKMALKRIAGRKTTTE
jgi:3',5'-nucleoside bisphosphate phosphatase